VRTKFGDLPDAVRQFLERRVETVEQLEIILLLQRQAARSWNAADVADALGFEEVAAAGHLEALGRRDLLDVRLGQNVRYRYSPATPELDAVVKQVADAYRYRRGAVLAFVTARRRRGPLQDFSDALKITGDPDDA
jgi:hypothetical protein